VTGSGGGDGQIILNGRGLPLRGSVPCGSDDLDVADRSAALIESQIAPPFDHADITALLGARVVMDVLATLVEHGHLGSRLSAEDRANAERARNQAAGLDNRYLPMLGDRHHSK
jgi:hypothetical protein